MTTIDILKSILDVGILYGIIKLLLWIRAGAIRAGIQAQEDYAREVEYQESMIELAKSMKRKP